MTLEELNEDIELLASELLDLQPLVLTVNEHLENAGSCETTTDVQANIKEALDAAINLAGKLRIMHKSAGHLVALEAKIKTATLNAKG